MNDSLNVVDKLEVSGINDDKITTVFWVYNKFYLLKDVIKVFYGNKIVSLVVYFYLGFMRIG